MEVHKGQNKHLVLISSWETYIEKENTIYRPKEKQKKAVIYFEPHILKMCELNKQKRSESL